MFSLYAVYACSFSSAEAIECSLYFLNLDFAIEPLSMMHGVCLLVIFIDGKLLMCIVWWVQAGSERHLQALAEECLSMWFS